MDAEFKKDLSVLYIEMAPHIEKYTKIPIQELAENQYKSVLLAAFAKCYEFNVEINSLDDNKLSFYFTSFLRGICEDLISLAFLNKIKSKDRESIISNFMMYLLHSSIASQQTFFSKERPFQPVVSHENITDLVALYSKNLNQEWEKLGYRKDKVFPSVEHMAVDTNLKLLYDFLYHATSKTVHFSPNILLRTGWYKDDGEVRFSKNNFSDYYGSFNSFYGSYLFLEYVRIFKKTFGFSKDLKILTKRLQEILNEVSFYPEIVTFEEINSKRPSYLDYKILELSAEMDDEEREEFMKALPEMIEEIKKRGKKTSSEGETFNGES
jgi:hypothetical protein